MPSRIDDLLSRFAHLERELETEGSRARDRWRYQIELAAYAVRHGLSD
jgi:hypothetical protein